VLPITLTRAVLKRIAAVWIICLIVFSLQPLRPSGTGGQVHAPSFRHRAEHILAFGATALLLLALARNRKEALRAAGSVVILAVAIEISQYLIYSLRAFEWWDVREDTIGAAIALVAHQIGPVQRTLRRLFVVE
jgi:peptidoglycan/LPS O-acetylase OafA/YrhL